MTMKYKITLTDAEREILRGITSKHKSSGLLTKRALVLCAAENPGLSNKEIASMYHISIKSVENLRRRFVEEGFALALHGKKWGGHRPKTLDGRVEAHLLALRCSNPPPGHGAWTLRLLSEQMVSLEYAPAISHTSVGNLLKKTKSSPGRSKTG